MSTAEDPLRLLSNSLRSKREIRLLREDAVVNDLSEASHFSFPSLANPSIRVSLPVRTPTRYLNSKREPYDLLTLVLLYQLKDSIASEYFRQSKALNTPFVSAIDKGKIIDWLEGKRQAEDGDIAPEVGEGVTEAETGEDGGRPAKRARYTVNKDDLQAVKAILQAQEQRQLTDRKRILRGAKPHNFENVKSMVADRIAAAKEEFRKTSRGPAPAASQSGSSSSGHKKRLDPIIIVSPSSSALITMDNIKQFLEEGTFLANKPNASRSTEDVVSVMHKRQSTAVTTAVSGKRSSSSSATSKPARYLVINDSAALSKFGGDEAWDRVVCVMTTGQEWQFSRYRWSEPKELFHHVKGIHFAYTNAPPNEKVKRWNVTDLRIDPVKRHVDKSVVAEFWRVVEQHIAETKPYLAF